MQNAVSCSRRFSLVADRVAQQVVDIREYRKPSNYSA
jgi:hypothetical protein